MRKCKVFLLIGLMMFLLSGMSARAEEPYVYDQADLLTDEEEEEIETLAEQYRERWNLNFLAVTTADDEGKSSMEYADDFYDERFPDVSAEDGVLYLINMDNREIYLSTYGEVSRYLTDERIGVILDEAYEEIADGNYYGTFLTFFDETEYYLEQGIPSDQYNYDTETGEVDPYREPEGLTGIDFIIALVGALAAAGGTCGVILGKYQLKFEDFHYNAYTDAEVHLSVKEDRLINSFVTHRRIPKNNGSSSGGGSRSSIHTSSSGRSHGGGGRKF